jgi:hypothetical protein
MGQTEATVQRDIAIDKEIADYAAKSAEAVRAELHDAGIDPSEAVDAVKRLVQEKLSGKVRARVSAR